MIFLKAHRTKILMRKMKKKQTQLYEFFTLVIKIKDKVGLNHV